MAREIKFSLVYRDMWQSSGKYVPRVDQLEEVAPAIIDMGCFDRVETNGGAFEQVNLLFGENPNVAVRRWTAPFHKAGIQTHMLERGLNALRMNPVPADVRELMYKVKKAQGTDVARSFCGLNDHRNLKLSVEFAKKAGMISQVALSITNSPVHTVEYYMGIVDKVVEYGCDEICLKDMAGVGRPTFLAELTNCIEEISAPYRPVPRTHRPWIFACINAGSGARGSGLSRRCRRTALLGQNPSGCDNHQGNDEGRRIPRERPEHGRIHGSPQAHAEIH